MWENIEEKKISEAAREWAQPGGGGDRQEPWVFLVGGDVVEALLDDAVASDQQLEDAVKRLVGA